MIDMNRLAIARNGYQGSYKRVLTVCSGGVLRAPTAAWVLGQEPYNTTHARLALSPMRWCALMKRWCTGLMKLFS